MSDPEVLLLLLGTFACYDLVEKRLQKKIAVKVGKQSNNMHLFQSMGRYCRTRRERYAF